MVKFAKAAWFVSLLLVLGEVSFASSAVSGTVSGSNFYQQSSPPSTALGLPIGGHFQTGVLPASPATNQQVISGVSLNILGVILQALTASLNPPNTIDGVTYTEFYSFGKRVFSQSAYVNTQGNLAFSAGLAPAEVRVPLVVYPVGPVSVTIDGGARFQADIQGSLVPSVVVPSTLSSLGVQLAAVADGAGFIEGFVSFLVLRAGVGGQVDLVKAQANLNASLPFDGSPPFARIDAMVDFLSGRLYAFLDYFNLLGFSFKRLLDYDLYNWKGYCYDTGAFLCP